MFFSTWHICASSLVILTVLATASGQQVYVQPSNDTSEIPPYSSSPRWWINGTDSQTSLTPFEIVPLGWYAQIAQPKFLSIQFSGKLVQINTQNANNYISGAFDFVSCDPADYTGELGPSDIFKMVVTSQQGNSVILYSRTSQHCDVSSLQSVGVANGVFSTLDPVLAATTVNQLAASAGGINAALNPDRYSYTNTSGYTYDSLSSGPTTAVAMIILYTITGIITAMFVVIIVTGAVRAHRHPERYGPSQGSGGRPGRSRAKGLARAMLETIPIVKFGEDKPAETGQQKEQDIEMTASAPAHESKTAHDQVTEATPIGPYTSTVAPESSTSSLPVAHSNSTSKTPQSIAKPISADPLEASAADPTCSICTEDFQLGDEIRLLPCNHKFHPVCVDPWLLNVSGTCPLCRVDLRPIEDQQRDQEGTVQDLVDGDRRLSDHGPTTSAAGVQRPRRDTIHAHTTSLGMQGIQGLRSLVNASREERVAALRRFRERDRAQRRNRTFTGNALNSPSSANLNTTTTSSMSMGTADGNGPADGQNPNLNLNTNADESGGLANRLRDRFRTRTRRQGANGSQ